MFDAGPFNSLAKGRDQATGRLGRNSRPRGLKVALGSPEGDKNFIYMENRYSAVKFFLTTVFKSPGATEVILRQKNF